MKKLGFQNKLWLVFLSLASLAFASLNGILLDYTTYIPFIEKPIIPTPSSTLTPTRTPTCTPTPDLAIGNINIIAIHYAGTGPSEPDEYVEVFNYDHSAILLAGWTLRDHENTVYTFPAFYIQPQQNCRIYTNQDHPEYCGFNFGSNIAVWNNDGECAYLFNAQNVLVDQYCYKN